MNRVANILADTGQHAHAKEKAAIGDTPIAARCDPLRRGTAGGSKMPAI